MDLMRLVGRNVRQLRSARDWSQEELAEKSDLSQQLISRLEAGQQNATLRTLARLATAFGVDASELLDTQMESGAS